MFYQLRKKVLLILSQKCQNPEHPAAKLRYVTQTRFCDQHHITDYNDAHMSTLTTLLQTKLLNLAMKRKTFFLKHFF